jgi:hypothetical protein
MSSVIFQSASRIIAQVLQWLQTSGQNKTANLITDAFQTGVVPLELGEFSVVPGSNNTPTTPTITIGSGVAYGLDSSRITIATGDTTPYNAAAPSDTTNDGLGNLLPTPQSTGCVNIPLTQSSQNYVWIQYLATIDTNAFTLNKETNAKQFYKGTDGYQITVTTTNVSPGANYLYLANVNMLGGGAVTSSVIFITGRTYFQIAETVVPITTPQAGINPPDRTPVYAPASTYTLEAHIKAVGHGSGISPTNPHNMALTDLGVSALDTVQEHRLLEHGGGGNTSVTANAIIAGVPGTPFPAASAMAQSINIVNPGSDTLNIFALSASEFAIVNGSAFNANDIFGAVPTNATVMFPDASGTYDVYWDSVAKVFGVTAPAGNVSTDITKLLLATVTYTFVGHGVSDHNALSSLIDRRRIGSTTHLLQRWTTNSRPGVDSSLNPQSGEVGFNTTTNLMEYWNGTTWNQPVTVLTAPTVQRFTSGSGTYTTPSSPRPLYLKVRVVGGGGGGSGSGSGTSTGGNGGAGSSSSFFNMICGGGSGGIFNNATPMSGGTGGTATAGGGVTYTVIQNGGQGGTGDNSGSVVYGPGGSGGSTPFSSGAEGNQNTTGTNGEANTGEGGSGGGFGGTLTVPGAGGGAGAYLEGLISSPATSYAYAVGSGGSAGGPGTSGFAGGAGGSGYIVVEEHYQ